ncbi:MAG: leucine-rich repeat domain-containing protein [Oscillospiraceae bacterium]|nr:leucine-rich repeat domain-containing protein [Oscillospiraceae bacterium]
MDDFVIEKGVLIRYQGNSSTVVVPDGVRAIGFYAFMNCRMNSVVLPDGLRVIERAAFHNCHDLTDILIPDGVAEIGGEAFSGTGLTSVRLPQGLLCISRKLFTGCTSLTSVTIPGSVTSIGNFAFAGCVSLRSVRIPGNVGVIGDSAFAGCTALTSVQFPYDLMFIRKEAFRGCTALTSVNVTECVLDIRQDAFAGCTALTDISIRGIRFGSDALHALLPYATPGDILCWLSDYDPFQAQEHPHNFARVVWTVRFINPSDERNNGYIMRHTDDMRRLLIELNDGELLQKALDTGLFFDKYNIDDAIEHAVCSQALEAQLLLTTYKAEVFGYASPFDQLQL